MFDPVLVGLLAWVIGMQAGRSATGGVAPGAGVWYCLSGLALLGALGLGLITGSETTWLAERVGGTGGFLEEGHAQRALMGAGWLLLLLAVASHRGDPVDRDRL